MEQEMRDPNRKERPGRAFLWLLLIPAQAVIDILLIALGTHLDTSVADSSQPGHPAPAFTLVFFIAAALISVVVVIVSVILTAKRYRRLKAEAAKGDLYGESF